jgi:putative transposase
MPQYRRAKLAGGTFFVTLVTYRRRPLFRDALARTLLGDSFRDCLNQQPPGLDFIPVTA